MTDPRPPAWQAVEIGPGALDPLLIRPVEGRPGPVPVGPIPGVAVPSGQAYPMPVGPGPANPRRSAPVPAQVLTYQPGHLAVPSAAVGNFGTGQAGPRVGQLGAGQFGPGQFAAYPYPPIAADVATKPPSRWRRIRDGKHFGTIVIGAIIAVILTTVVWATAVVRSDELSAGDCLTLGTLLPSEVDCESADAEFRVISRYDDTTDYTRCASDEPDAGLAISNSVLCVNYVARVGDCLFADEGSSVGKEPCSSQSDGLYQVIEVITNSLDAGNCPEETDQVLVHRSELEVICLIENP